MSTTTTFNGVEKPAWLADWKSGQETIAIFRQIRPKFHHATLTRMRQKGNITATKFAGQWFYKPETALPKAQ